MKILLLLAATSAMPIAFMSDGRCETVMAKIKGGSGDYVRVNKSDVEADPDSYTVSDKETAKAAENQPAPATAGVQIPVAEGVIVPPAPSAPAFAPAAPEMAAPAGPVPPTVPAIDAKLVMKVGKKYVVVHSDGTPWEGIEGIDPKGYDSEKAANEAIAALPH